MQMNTLLVEPADVHLNHGTRFVSVGVYFLYTMQMSTLLVHPVCIHYIQFESAVARDLLKCTLTTYIYGYVLGLMIWSIVTLSCCRIIHNLKCHRLKIKLNDRFILRIEMTFGVQNQKNV